MSRRSESSALERAVMTKISRTVRTALAGTAVAVGLVLANSSPAAAFTATDGMEPPTNVWTFHAVGAGSGAGYTGVGPHGGVRALHIFGKSPGYAYARRVMFLDDERDCTASVWVDPKANSVPTAVNFEIVDPATNTYINLKSVTLSSAAGYTRISTAFLSPKANVDVRVAVGTSVPGATVAATVDDLTMDCTIKR
jgi:hypothetical protein